MKSNYRRWCFPLLLAGLFSTCKNESTVGVGNSPCQDQTISQLLVGSWQYAASFSVEDASHTTNTIPKQGSLVFEPGGMLGDPNQFFLATYKAHPVLQRRYALLNDTLRITVRTQQDTVVMKTLLESKTCNRLVLGRWFDAKTASPGLSLTLSR